MPDDNNYHRTDLGENCPKNARSIAFTVRYSTCSLPVNNFKGAEKIKTPNSCVPQSDAGGREGGEKRKMAFQSQAEGTETFS